MAGRRKNRSSRYGEFVMNLFHILVCIAIVACAVILFLNPTRFEVLFPVVFVLAAFMQFLHGIPKLVEFGTARGGGDALTLLSGVVLCILGVALTCVTAASIVTVWW